MPSSSQRGRIIRPRSLRREIVASPFSRRPTIRRFDVLQARDRPARFILYEAYASPADATAHKETAHYLAWREAVGGMMAEPRRGEPMNGLLPA